jgi:hypothetical protein
MAQAAPMPMCPMAETCRGMMKKPLSGLVSACCPERARDLTRADALCPECGQLSRPIGHIPRIPFALE